MKAVKLYTMEDEEREAWLKRQSLAALADMYYTVREKRLAAQKVGELIEKDEGFLREFLIANLPLSDATGIAGKLARVSVTASSIPTVENWDAFYAYVKKSNSFDLLQRRVSDKAVMERWEAGKAIPGVGKFTKKKLSISVVKQRKGA